MSVPDAAAARLLSLAERIDTGTSDPDTSRALVVFNLTDHPLSGTAAFHADMSWPAGIPLPPVAVHGFRGMAVPSALTDYQEAPDTKGRPERRQLSFTLRFLVQDVPAHGWKTYIASYVPERPPDADLPDPATSLTVVETRRHPGDLPPVGTVPKRC